MHAFLFTLLVLFVSAVPVTARGQSSAQPASSVAPPVPIAAPTSSPEAASAPPVLNEPPPTGWEPNSPLYSQILIVPPLVALAAEEPLPAGWPPSITPTELATRSTEFFQLKQYLESADQLELAFAIDPQPLFAFNLAQAYRLADQPHKAIARYQRFIRLFPSNRFVPEAKGYIADMRVLAAERARTEMAQKLLEAEQIRARQEAELLQFRAQRAEEEKRILTEQLRKSNRPVYKRAYFWALIGSAAAVAGVAIGVGTYFATTPKVEGGIVDIRF